jgi:Ankyrin repeats (3 copies)
MLCCLFLYSPSSTNCQNALTKFSWRASTYMNSFNFPIVTNTYDYLAGTQKHPEEREQIQAQIQAYEQTQGQTIVESQLDMANKKPFYFLHLVQKQLIEAKKPNLIFDDTTYPEESRETWLAFENAVRVDDREKAESLRMQLLSTSGSLIKPKCTTIENPQSDREVVQNILTKALCQSSSSIPEKMLCYGLEENSLPLIYLALKCGVQPEKLFKDDMGREHHFLKIALDNPKPCGIAGIRLLFQFARNSTNLANGTLSTTPTPRSAFSPLKKAFEIGRLDVVRELLAHGANPEIAWNQQQHEESLFIYAADKGHSEIVQLFLQVGFPVNYQDKNGRTALHFAKLRKNRDLIQDLLNTGADLNLKDNKGWNYHEFAKEGWKQFDKNAREKLISAFQINQ